MVDSRRTPRRIEPIPGFDEVLLLRRGTPGPIACAIAATDGKRSSGDAASARSRNASSQFGQLIMSRDGGRSVDWPAARRVSSGVLPLKGTLPAMASYKSTPNE